MCPYVPVGVAMRSGVLRCSYSRHLRLTSGAGLILVIALSACGTSHDTAAIRSSPSPVPTWSSTIPTVAGKVPSSSAARKKGKARRSPATTPVSAGLSARPSAAKTTASAPASAPLRVPTAADLQAALLTAADLPAGYSAQPVSESDLGGSSLSGCPALTSNPMGVSDQAAVNLTGPGAATSVSETLMQLTAGDAAKAMASYAAMSTSCRSFTGQVDTYPVAFSTAPLAVTALGDQRTAVRITGYVLALHVSIYTDVVVVRHGGTLIVVIDVGLTPETAFTGQIASKAYAKVAARW
jgi:hypothetical protein